MKYKDQLVQFLLDWPTLFLNEDDVLEHIFLTIGTGLEWECGELVSIFEDDCSDARLLAERARPWEARINTRNWREECLNIPKSRYYIPTVFRTSSGHIGRWLRICEFRLEPIFNLPDDIQPDWLDAAARSLAYARSNRVRKTRAQIALLSSVSSRIKELRKNAKTNIQVASIAPR